MTEFDSLRPPEPARRRRTRGGRTKPRAWRDGGDGAREMLMVPDVEFTSYYGRPVVKPAPWKHEIPAYLFLGGVAGGSGLIAFAAQLSGRELLRRNARLGGLVAISLGGAALVKDLGRPERFYNMLRTFKVSSPMSMGSWILTGYSAGAGVVAVAELDRLTGERLPMGPLRRVMRRAEPYAGFEAALFSPPLASYTAVLLSDTATPTWNDARKYLPFVFVSSATLAASGLAMVTTPTSQTGPVRTLAVLGVIGDVVNMKVLERSMDPTVVETLHQGKPGTMLRWAERLAVLGGVGAAVGGGRRPVAVGSGLALLTASALTRFGVFDAGIESAKDPKYTIEPQKRRLAARRANGITGDSITTAG